MRPAVIALLAAVLLAPATAAAQTPFQPLPAAPQEQPAPAAPTASNDGGGITSMQQTLLIAAGIVLVVGIGVAIARDARKNAPVEERAPRGVVDGATAEGDRRKLDPRAAQKQKAAAKRARQARKRNRPVRK